MGLLLRTGCSLFKVTEGEFVGEFTPLVIAQAVAVVCKVRGERQAKLVHAEQKGFDVCHNYSPV